ncbi:MAG TPA: hypothetical protein VMT34_06640, partial [Aggregatilineales bacterium]|nr:hypothetical protein [Aggregatilineales bacterium]
AYQLALHSMPVSGGRAEIRTIAGIARKAIETYWPLVARPTGFADPNREPTFLNIELAQYFMARLVNPVVRAGRFDAVNVGAPRIISQVLDNLDKAAILRFPIDQVAERLIAAWTGKSDRPPVYDAARELAAEFRTYCLANNLLDFSLVIETFNAALRDNPRFTKHFITHYDYLIADNLEEDNPAAHDFIRWMMPYVEGALLIYDTDGGYRIFLGADAESGYELKSLCDQHLTMTDSVVMTPPLAALGRTFDRLIGPSFDPAALPAVPTKSDGTDPQGPLAAFQFTFNHYYPQMVSWAADRIGELVASGVKPHEIAVLAPYLNDALRFELAYQLNRRGIQTLSHRPSRALRDEPVTRALLTLTALAHPSWTTPPPMTDVADALAQTIAGLDPVRARLLAQIVYRNDELSSFALINTPMQQRITYQVGESYETLRFWIKTYQSETGAAPLDHFLSRLFGELLSQPGYGLHRGLEGGRITAQLIASAAQFRQALYPGTEQDWNEAGREYLSLVHQGLLSALFAQSWADEDVDAVFLAPAFTFLMRNRFVDYQVWIDTGSNSWAERLEQPLTHPYVLRRSYPPGLPWTDDLEAEAQQELLHRIVMGLVRRCRKGIYLGITDFGESGYEQRGPLLGLFQRVLRLHGAGDVIPTGANDSPVES